MARIKYNINLDKFNMLNLKFLTLWTICTSRFIKNEQERMYYLRKL